jgi:hypothetical protein
MLHVLVEATAQDGKRPAGHADIVALNLAGSRVTGAGLKELKGLQTLYLSDTQA